MKKISLIITIGLFSISVFAQKQQNRHEVSVWGAGGISTLQYDLPADGERKTGFGALGGIGYSYFFNYNWSLGIGAEFSVLNAKSQFETLSDNYLMADPSSTMLLRIKTEGQNYEEAHHAYFVNIPIMARFQTDITEKAKFYVAAGPKIGLPIKSNFDSWGALTTTGLELDASGLPHTNDWYADMPNHGFSTYGGGTPDQESDLKLNFIAAIETGVKWQLNNKWSLYTGLFLDYGLNDIRDVENYGEHKNFFDRNRYESSQYTRNSVFFSDYNGTPFVDRVNTFSFGVKAQLAFGFSPFNKKEKVAPAAAVAAEKPYEGLTAAQMEDILARNTQQMMEFQRKEFEALKDLITKEDPELTQAIINFDLDRKEILPRMYAELDKKVALLNKYPKAKLMLEGHTDDLGSDEYNYQLGLDRANAAKNYLVSKGIDPSRLSVSSKGKTQPVVANSTDANRFYNRRVEFILIQ